MTINERVSPKRLAEIIARAEVCDDSVLTDYRDIESIARELQQYRAAAEPVCPKCGGTGMADSGGVQPWGEPIFIECDCHAAPQLPLPAVVPDAIEIDDDFDSAFEHGKAVGWNAYRAAMLQGAEQVSQPYTLPEHSPCADAPDHIWLQTAGEWPASGEFGELTWSCDNQHPDDTLYVRADLVGNFPCYLQGYKDGCEWSALMAEANHPQTGDWLFDDPIELAKAIRKGPDMLPAEPGNSPAIPDGYALVPVEPTMPMLDEFDSIIDYGAEDSKDAWSRLLAAAWVKSLPAAPKQEAE